MFMIHSLFIIDAAIRQAMDTLIIEAGSNFQLQANQAFNCSHSIVCLVEADVASMSTNHLMCMLSILDCTRYSSLALLHSSSCINLKHICSDAGTLPVELVDWEELVELNLTGNHLTGPLPESLGAAGAWPALASLDLSSNALSGQLTVLLG